MPLAFLAPPLLYAGVLLLHLLVPARAVDGYVTDAATGRPLRYRLNGLRVFLLVVLGWAALCNAGLLEWDWLYLHRWETAAGACATGLVFTLAIVLPAPPVRGLFKDLYLGRLENPQLLGGRVDAKMFLYLAGALLLELNLLSAAAHHLRLHAEGPSRGVLLYAGLFSFFCTEYLWFEEVHLYTYDFVAERVGFKLGWGCLAFYPFFYPIGLWWAAPQPSPHAPGWLLAGSALVFFSGWALSRGANLQKYWFKRDPARLAFGLLEPRALTGGGRSVLTGGFWGLSRHINYLGELCMAAGLALSLGYPLAPGPWLYFGRS
jgi:delta14-sterol reductase